MAFCKKFNALIQVAFSRAQEHNLSQALCNRQERKTADPAHIVKRVVDKAGGLEFFSRCPGQSAPTQHE
jgi:hypothetical protein